MSLAMTEEQPHKAMDKHKQRVYERDSKVMKL
jgi:hypothetical protein